MSYILSSTTIRRPTSLSEANDTQVAVQRALDGTIRRDYYGSNKRVWTLVYENVLPTEYNTIKTIYDSYLSTSNLKTWEITETNYTIPQTQVHVDLVERGFSIKGDSYLSSFELILTEA